MKKDLANKSAFTLAEVLVTLGIIGVVSALTMPTLVQNYQKRVYVSQLHKVYNELHQATERMLQDKNAVNLLEAGLIKGKEGEFLSSYFKIVKDCKYDSNACFASYYKSLLPSSKTRYAYTTPSSVYTIINASGASIGLQFAENSEQIGRFSGAIGKLYVDVNGLKGPNNLVETILH